jgi:4'-phosphopantetheinyl transferase
MSDASPYDPTSYPGVSPVWHDVIRGFHRRTDGAIQMKSVTDSGTVSEDFTDDGSETSAQRDTWRTWLSEAERTCLESFGSEKRRREFIAGRAAARSLLAHRLSCDPADVPLRIANDGAVDVVRDAPDGSTADGPIHLSIAHSGPHAVAAVSEEAVGVDLEEIVPRDARLERFLMAPDQRGLIGDWPYDRDASLVLAWTLKEAVLKARRSGFRLSPKKLHLTLNVAGDEDDGRGEATISVAEGDTWRVWFDRVGSSATESGSSYWCAVGLSAGRF